MDRISLNSFLFKGRKSCPQILYNFYLGPIRLDRLRSNRKLWDFIVGIENCESFPIIKKYLSRSWSVCSEIPFQRIFLHLNSRPFDRISFLELVSFRNVYLRVIIINSILLFLRWIYRLFIFNNGFTVRRIFILLCSFCYKWGFVHINVLFMEYNFFDTFYPINVKIFWLFMIFHTIQKV